MDDGKSRGRADFRGVHGAQIDRPLVSELPGSGRRKFFLLYTHVRLQPGQGFFQDMRFNPESVAAQFHQQKTGHADVSLFGRLMQYEKDARFGSQWGVGGKSQVPGESVRSEKTHSSNVHCQAIRIFPYDIDRLLPVILKNPGCEGRARPVGAQEDH